ncbi:hypothetical protein B0T20DRAFT_28123 [Sordaria brevicollis]|uniref:Cyclase n=1 Tax=Sordaria brevicollis TaxID=83679 RepID=A0AAE0UGX2_SORBR|nr:hypothetical protein B0T20DRAFT_28123 [Sordaria brevicollis]
MSETPSTLKLNENGIPDFDSLPLRPGDPKYSAWGLYGDKDELGTLNRLTDELVAEAAKNEIKTGVRVSLNWPLNAQRDSSFFNRQLFHQDLFAKPPRCVNDDVWTFNPQVSSQWDGLRHFAYQKEKLFYNGVTMEDIHEDDGGTSGVIGVQAWAKKGIVSRGILVDFHSWRLEQINNTSNPDPRLVDFDHFATKPISLEDIKACLEWQGGTEVKFGDILFIRSGWINAHNNLLSTSPSTLTRHQTKTPHTFCGLSPSPALFEFIWSKFAAVAGDQPSLECWPPLAMRDPVNHGDKLSLHEVMLAGWGMPIGELFDLEELARECERQKRWSFFVSSEVCNVKGGVASPPNALAIF